MRFHTSILALLLSANVVTAADDKVEWMAYSSDDHKCAIQFPGKPTEKGDKNVTQVTLSTMRGKAVYLLQMSRSTPAVPIENAAYVGKILDRSRDAMMKSLKGSKVLSDKNLFLDKKYPARDVELEVPGQGIHRVRFLLTPTHFYQIIVAGPKEFVEGEDCKKFLDSFQLKK